MDSVSQGKWRSLPTELKLKVLHYLNPEDLNTCCSLSRDWRILANSDILWKRLYVREFFDEPQLDVPSYQCGGIGEWRFRYFMERKLLLRNWKEGRYEISESFVSGLDRPPPSLLADGAIGIFWSRTLDKVVVYDSIECQIIALDDSPNKPPKMILTVPGELVVMDTDNPGEFAIYKWSGRKLGRRETLVHKGDGQFERRRCGWRTEGEEGVCTEAIGVVGAVMAFHSDGCLHFVSLASPSNSAFIFLGHLFPEGLPQFRTSADSLFTFDSTRLVEFNSGAEIVFQVEWRGEVERVWEVVRSKDFLVVGGHLADGVWGAIGWQTRGEVGRLAGGRPLLGAQALIAHPMKPFLYVVPLQSNQNPHFTVQCFDLSGDPVDWTAPVWETALGQIAPIDFSTRLYLVSAHILSVTYQHTTERNDFRMAQAVVDPLGGAVIRQSIVHEGWWELALVCRSSLLFVHRPRAWGAQPSTAGWLRLEYFKS